MGVYSGSNMYRQSYSINDTLESIMNDNSLEESAFDDPIEASYNAILETEQNYNNIMMAIGIQELAVLEGSGQDMVYSESVIGDLFTKIKAFFLKIWEKIKGIFKHFTAKLDVYMKSDKEFVKKYKKQILAVTDLSDFTFKGWDKFTLDGVDFLEANNNKLAQYLDNFDKITKISNTSGGETGSVAKKYHDDRTKLSNLIRGTALGKDQEFDSKEFHDEVFEKLHNGDSEKEELDKFDTSSMLLELETSKDTKKELKKSYNDVKKSIDSILKELDNEEKTAIKIVPGDKNKTKFANNSTSSFKADETSGTSGVEKKDVINAINHNHVVFTTVAECNTTINSMKLAVIKERSTQYKSCCVAIMHHKPKNEGFTESAGYHDDSTNFLASVVLH